MIINGFIDLQINGYKGIDFSSDSLTTEGCYKAFKGIIACGTIIFLPTVITSPINTLIRNLGIIAEAISAPEFEDHIPGIHLEGPFFANSSGIGAHNPKYIQIADVSILEKLIKVSKNKIKLLTVGADLENVDTLIRFAVKSGIKVSLGHHMADLKQISSAKEAGATNLTHLGNGVANLVNRHENPIWAGLSVNDLKAMIITDGHHLPINLIKIFLKVKGIENIIVVSDAAPLAGMSPGKYFTLGNNVVLRSDGKLFNPEKECLVGSSAMMIDCMNFLFKSGCFSYKDLATLGFKNQLEYLGIDFPEKLKHLKLVRFSEENGFALIV
ncbi:MAG: N-acetylglucosamine-6-phosphate deacetylase [Lentisphaerota bacterium]